MKTSIIIFLASFVTCINAQDVTDPGDITVTIEINQTYFKKSYSSWTNDSMFITARIRNSGSETILLRDAPQFSIRGESNYHCFRVYPSESIEVRIKPEYQRTRESFVEIKPGEELVHEHAYSLGWICRGAPPDRPWFLKLQYYREITPEDNHFLFKSYYSGNYEKVYIDAWTGTLKSNEIDITIE